MSEFLNQLMNQENSVINKKFYKLPDIMDMTYENLDLKFDKNKNESYLFYVENPIQEQVGYRKDLKIFIIKANPYTSRYNKEIGDYYDQFNIIDGDTMRFDVDSIVDSDTAFDLGDKHYSSFKAFLKANNQDMLTLRILGLDAPELVHYKEVPILTSEKEYYITQAPFSKAVKEQQIYTLDSLEYGDNDILNFFSSEGSYLQVVEMFEKAGEENITYLKVVTSNETLSEPIGYLEEAESCKHMLIDLLNRASDIRLVLDHQSLNRKPSDFSTPYDQFEHLTPDGLLSKTFSIINSLWEQLFSHEGYAYRGFNPPGQDTHGRSLGELYVKIYVSEFEKEVWVNAAKYILYHHDKFIKAVPAFTSNPTDNFHNNFLSPAFKLNTYDKTYREILDSFTHVTGKLIEERDKWYEEITNIESDYLKEHTVIIGDCVLAVPPMNIRTVTETNHTKIPLLRSKGSVVKSLPRSQKILEMDIYFNNENGINGKPCEFKMPTGKIVTYYMNGLRSLIAQFKLTPFLPIENYYINDDLMIDAVSLVNLNVTTVPNYPKCLKATLTLAEFNYSIYMPELPESDLYNTFSQSIHYPVMRWYYQRLLQNGESIKEFDFNSEPYLSKTYGSRTALVPMKFENSRLRFYIPDRNQLQQRLDIISETKPIMTQEQLTDEMKKGAKRLGPLLENVTKLSSDLSFRRALNTFFTMDTFNPKFPIMCSEKLNEEGFLHEKNVPLFPLLKEGENELVFYNGGDTLLKMPLLYRKDIGINTPVDMNVILPEDEIFIKANEQLNAITKSLNSLLGIFGSVEGYAKVENNQLHLGAIVPLPAELSQSAYEIKMIAKKICTQFNLDANEANKFLKFTSGGMLSVPVEILFDLKPVAHSSWDNTLTYYAIDRHDFYSELPPYRLNMGHIGIRILDYLYSIVSSETDSGMGDTIEEHLINEKKDIVLNEAMGLKFVEYNAGDLLIEQIAINYNNTFSNMTLNMIDGKAFQYCGAQDMNIQFSLISNSELTLNALTHLPEISAEYARSYRKVLNCWPLRIESEFTKLFGVCEVLIESVNTETIPNQPGYTRITVSMSVVDRTVRQKEALSRIDAETNAGSIAYGNKGKLEVKTYFDLKHALAKAELYPDLELPTISELREAGYLLYRDKHVDINKPDRVFVDPDFYFIYGQALACEIFRKNFLESFSREEQSYNLTDTEGAYTRLILKKSQKDAFDIENKNNIAQMQRDFYTETVDILKQYDYKDYSNEIHKALKDREKNTHKLSQSLAELGTEFWNFTDKVKIPFRESACDLMPETVTTTHNTIKKEMIEAIDDLLSVPIEENIPSQYNKTIKAGTSFKKQVKQFEHLIELLVSNLFLHKKMRPFILATNKEYTSDVSYYNFENSLKGILLAYADTYSGEGYYNNQNIAVDIDNEANRKFIWKAKLYRNTDKNNPIPIALVNNNSGSFYATSIEDALNNGYSFGPFNISFYKGETIKHLFKTEKLKNNENYFLDPYYAHLQITDQKDKIDKHKEYLLTRPIYGGMALLRQLLFLYKYYLEEGIFLSLYEIARREAYIAWGSPNRVENDNIVDYVSDKTEEEKKAIKKRELAIMQSFLEVLKSLSAEKIETKAEREAIAYEVLRLEEDNPVAIAIVDINGNIMDYVFDFGLKENQLKSLPAQDINKLAVKYKKLYEETKNDGKTDEETVSRYKKLYEICNNYENVDVVEFAQDILEMIILYNSDASFSQDVALQSLKQIAIDEEKMFAGRFLATACALIEPQTIHRHIQSKNIDALNLLIMNASKPDITDEYSKLRKFLYALDGRKVIELATIGIIPLTLEAQYRNYLNERIYIERSNNPSQYLRDSFFDMIKNDKRGRMLRAFPTYYMFFIDEGREIGLWKLHDNFYSSTAIVELEITKSRKVAADTAHIVLSNLFNSYTKDDKDFVYDLDSVADSKSIRYKVHDAFNALFSPRTYFDQEEKERLNTPTPLTARLTPGTRMHIRMGYGANAAELPIVFNGQIAEIGNGEVCEIVAQGDGVELLNPIQDTKDAADIQFNQEFKVQRFFKEWLTNGATPKTILGSILTANGNWLDKKVEKYSNGYILSRNPFGIEHFGDVKFDEIFKGSECIQNLFEANSRAIYDNGQHITVGLESKYMTNGAPLISVDAIGKTPWDMMHICASVSPDFITAVVPFELRSSIFMGSGRDYYAYEYALENSSENNTTYICEKRKPFEQYHYYTSYSDIIANNIVASSTYVKTNAIGLYSQTMGFGKVKHKETERLFVDYSIYNEYQKATTVDTQLWAQGMPVLGNGFFLGINADTDDDVDDLVPGAKEIAWRMTASTLKNCMKDMYQGELIIMGDPSVKPYDRMLITDLYEEMQGAAWVESVVHSFNAQTGFTTSLYADCINEIDDRYERQNDLLTKNACATAAAAYFTPVALNQLVFRKNMKLFNKTLVDLVLKGGIEASNWIDKNRLELAQAFNLLKLNANDVQLKTLQNAIKTANALERPFEGIGDAFKSRRLLHEKIAAATKSIFTKNGSAFSEMVLEPFNTIGNKLKAIENVKNASELVKLLKHNVSEIEKINGDYLLDLIQMSNDGQIDTNDLRKIQRDIQTYNIMFNDSIYNTFKLNENTRLVLNDLADHILKSDIDAPDIKSAAALLKRYEKADKTIDNLVDLQNFVRSLSECVDVCQDTAILKNLASSMDNIRDFTKIADTAKDITKMVPDIKKLTMAVGSLTGPVGIVASILLAVGEMAISAVIGAYATEAVERYLQNLQVMRIYPLSKNGKVMTAGITGHKGLVVGSPTENMEDSWTEFVTGLFGAKEPDGIISGIIQFFFASEKAKSIASKYRVENHVPNVLDSGYDYRALEAKFNENFNHRIGLLGTQNEMLNLNLNRYDDLQKSSHLFKKYVAKSESNSIELTTQTLKEFIPIRNHLSLSRFIDDDVLLIMHELNQEDILHARFNHTSQTLPIFYESDKMYNAPILRRDALTVLNLLVNKYVEVAQLNKPTLDLEERIKVNQLQLTSATIVNSQSYDGTGFVFRITSQNIKMLETACYELTRELNKNKTIMKHFESGKEHIIAVAIPEV